MASAHLKVLQYLQEAHASERALTRVLESQIAMAPDGPLRDALIAHLEETRHHAAWVAERLSELRQTRTPRMRARGIAQTAAGQVAALTKTPIDLVRGTDGAEKVLKNTRDARATEALEIATYTAIEQVAKSAGDRQTERLAASIRAEEEAMLARLLAEIPALAQSVVDGSFDLSQTGAGEAVRDVATVAAKVVRTAGEAVQDSVAAVRGDGDGDEPWKGYDELTVPAVKTALASADDDLVRTVSEYERAHKARAGVLKAVDRDVESA